MRSTARKTLTDPVPCAISTTSCALAGATARTMLENAAAAKWGVPADECHGQNHFVVHAKTGRKLAYGELVRAGCDGDSSRTRRHPAQDARSVPLYRQRHSHRRSEGLSSPAKPRSASTRACREWFTRPSSVLPVMGAALKSCDDAEAKQVKGVEQVVMLDLAKPPYGVQAAGRRGGDRQQQLDGAPGPQETESRMGSGRARRIRFGSL